MISTDGESDDETDVNETSLIDRDVVGEPLSDADELATFEDDVWRDALNVTNNEKDPIEGIHFEGDISGVRLVSRTDLNGRNVTIKNAIINTYQV